MRKKREEVMKMRATTSPRRRHEVLQATANPRFHVQSSEAQMDHMAVLPALPTTVCRKRRTLKYMRPGLQEERGQQVMRPLQSEATAIGRQGCGESHGCGLGCNGCSPRLHCMQARGSCCTAYSGNGQDYRGAS